MGVYSELTRDDLAAAVAGWGKGRLVAAEPTPLGIENSNYFVVTEDASGDVANWVLTVMQEPPSAVVLALLEQLARAHLPVPAPVADLEGRIVGQVDGHPALLTPRFPGEHPQRPNVAQCRALGEFLGCMHRITEGLHGPAHPRNLAWLRAGQERHAGHLDLNTRQALHTAIDALASAEQRSDWKRLPTGLVHGDLFRDNALMSQDRVTGIIDFHHAATAPLAFDLAVAALDWCTDETGRLNVDLCDSMLEGYTARRTLTREELWHWPLLLILAGARFLVARLESPRKPPAEMAARLADRLARPMYLQPTPSTRPEA